MKDATPNRMRAPEAAQNSSKSAQVISAARAQHAEETRAIENLTCLLVSGLALRTTHARFAVHFLRALDLRDACATAGIGYETGRTYIKKLFDVTGTASQVELVVILGWVVRSRDVAGST